jgi:hypothetical protein
MSKSEVYLQELAGMFMIDSLVIGETVDFPSVLDLWLLIKLSYKEYLSLNNLDKMYMWNLIKEI